jgi:hypothetical protein
MDNMTFTETRKRNGHTFETTITVERTPSSLGELRAVRGRYWDYMGDSITEAYTVKVTFGGLSTWTDTYTEVVTASGRGCVINFQDGPELMAFIPNSGKALITGCWKKYGMYRGHAVGYLRAYGFRPESKKVDHTCCARIYNAAKGV